MKWLKLYNMTCNLNLNHLHKQTPRSWHDDCSNLIWGALFQGNDLSFSYPILWCAWWAGPPGICPHLPKASWYWPLTQKKLYVKMHLLWCTMSLISLFLLTDYIFQRSQRAVSPYSKTLTSWAVNTRKRLMLNHVCLQTDWMNVK